MLKALQPIATAADLLNLLNTSDLPDARHRDMISAVRRVCEMMGEDPGYLQLDPIALRPKLARIRPAAHRISRKTFANLRSLFSGALELAGVLDATGRGDAKRDPQWAGRVAAIAHDQRMAGGLAGFMNWCAQVGIGPEDVDDAAVQRFAYWLETRTLHPKPRDVVRRVPNLWNDAGAAISDWPAQRLERISFKTPSDKLAWSQLQPGFRTEAEAYLEMRAEPDLFDTDPAAPKRPLSTRSLAHQHEHLRLAASVLARDSSHGTPAQLSHLVAPEALKAVLRHYHARAEGKPSGHAVAIARTMIDVARYHAKLPDAALKELKAIVARLPPIPFDLSEKNKTLLRQLEGDDARSRLLFLPERLVESARQDLKKGRLNFVAAQAGIAIDILLVAPLRLQNLIELNWRRHFKEPKGSDGPLTLYIPKSQTKSGKRELTFELPEDVARKIRWYRRHILPALGADPNGDLFVTERGARKTAPTLRVQITQAVEEQVGVHMTPHQFRHFAAMTFLEEHPDSFQTVTDLLGHSWSKTTQIYAGSSSRRAGRAYSSHILEQREALKLKRRRPRRT